MQVFATLFASLLLCQYASAADAPGSDCPSVREINISAGNACRINEVAVACDSLGSRLKALHIASTCHVHIAVDRSSTYEEVRSALQSLREAGYIKVGFVNFAETLP
jgi:biopolymer transport protein ExbD